MGHAMQLRSLGFRSELVFTDFDGKIEDRGDYLVVRTLTNPHFFWGNLLIFDKPPQKGDFSKWVSLFKKEFTDPSIYHMTFAWDLEEKGDLADFEQAGFELERNIVLATSEVTEPPRVHSELQVRPLQGDEEWERMIQIQVDSAHGHLPRHEWEKFYHSQSIRYRTMEKAHRGHWFGGFINNQLIAGLGIFHDGNLGRYQIVSTHPDFRRQGVCGTLVYRSAQYALKTLGLKQLVMCADPDYHAARIYESVGFKPVQVDHGVCWWDRSRA